MNNLRSWILIFIGATLIFTSGYFFYSTIQDYNNECSGCVTQDCMSYIIICGDFGFYWFKFVRLIAMAIMGIFVIALNHEVNKNAKI